MWQVSGRSGLNNSGGFFKSIDSQAVKERP